LAIETGIVGSYWYFTIQTLLHCIAVLNTFACQPSILVVVFGLWHHNDVLGQHLGAHAASILRVNPWYNVIKIL